VDDPDPPLTAGTARRERGPIAEPGDFTAPSLSNADLGELLWRESVDEEGHRRRALERASRASRFWPEEAADLALAGRPLTELRAVGPWVAERIEALLEAPPAVPEPEGTRTGYLTMSQVRRVLDADPWWETTPHADLQVHSTDSDGSLPLREMAAAAQALGRSFIACTDHSESLQIAGGMDAERLRDQGRRIDALNAELAGDGERFRVLKSIEMDVFLDGSGDTDPAVLADLDLVLGAFHTKLRVTDDTTPRYVAALRNPDVHVLAHPTARMYGRRRGLVADWPRVFTEAAELGKAVELDATPARQDLNVDLAKVAVAAGVRWYSIGSDAHNSAELSFLPFGIATAAIAGVPRERILNYRSAADVAEWAATFRR
jgi:histidinol phosphatase-like PHP family hydrolase